MNIKIVASESGSNTGSSKRVVNYLEKENKGKAPSEKEWFFSHERDRVGLREVIESLDANKKKLSKKDAKFFMVNISPSQKELEWIGNDPEKLRAYTREVMDQYAKNFGKGLKGEDLLYYAKIEQHRYYKGTDPEVRRGKLKQGEKKPGLQTHIHVLVSRKDKANRLKLSPLSHHRNTQKGPVKGGFDRERFVQRAEEGFDQLFGYVRGKEETFSHLNEKKNGRKKPTPKQVPALAGPSKGLSVRGAKKLNQALRRDSSEHREVRKKRQEKEMEM